MTLDEAKKKYLDEKGNLLLEKLMKDRDHLGVDVHAIVAMIVFGTETPTNVQRQVSKHNLFSYFYWEDHKN